MSGIKQFGNYYKLLLIEVMVTQIITTLLKTRAIVPA